MQLACQIKLTHAEHGIAILLILTIIRILILTFNECDSRIGSIAIIAI